MKLELSNIKLKFTEVIPGKIFSDTHKTKMLTFYSHRASACYSTLTLSRRNICRFIVSSSFSLFIVLTPTWVHPKSLLFVTIKNFLSCITTPTKYTSIPRHSISWRFTDMFWSRNDYLFPLEENNKCKKQYT